MLGSITQWTYDIDSKLRVPKPARAGCGRLTLAALLDEVDALLLELDSYSMMHSRAGLLDLLQRARQDLELARAELCVTPCRGKSAGSCCSAAHSRLLDLLASVELALARAEGGASMHGGREARLLRQLLDARCGYCMLRAGLQQGAEQWPGRAGLQRRLRLARCWLSCMLELVPQQGARTLDHLELRELHARLDALTCAPDEREEEIEQALRDASSLGEDLMSVNSHPALIEHDRAVLGLLLAALDAGGSPPESLFNALDTLRGRDAGLDYLLETRTELRSELWRDVALHVLHGLS